MINVTVKFPKLLELTHTMVFLNGGDPYDEAYMYPDLVSEEQLSEMEQKLESFSFESQDEENEFLIGEEQEQLAISKKYGLEDVHKFLNDLLEAM